MPVTLNVNYKKAEWQGFLDEVRAAKALEDIYVEPATKYLAIAARDKLSLMLLNRVQGISVTATGVAATNLFVARLEGGGLHGASHVVYEGSATHANYYMRAGTPPPKGRKKKGRGGNIRIPVQNIMDWIREKGLANLTQLSAPLPSNTSSSPSSNLSLKRSAVERLAWAIAGGISKRGTSVGHKPLFPGNQKRFDYVTYAVKKAKILDDIYREFTATGLPQLHKIMVGFWKTGRYDKKSAYRTVRPKRT